MKKIVIGSRESSLAVAQSMTVVDAIRKALPDAQVSLLTMKTTGDRILDRTLDQIGGKGLFVKELDVALREGRADLTVHSLKDLPMDLPSDLPIVAMSRREDPRDVLVLPADRTELDPYLPIGSSSLRRALQLKQLYPGWEIRPVRGNLQTRLNKLDSGQYAALVLAAAGLKRLGLAHRISRYFSVEEMIPAAGQGILAVQGRSGIVWDCLKEYYDPESAAAAVCERAFVRELNGGCSSPVCAYAVVSVDQITLRGLYYDEASGMYRIGELKGSVSDAEELGRELARSLSKGR
ncbi:MAG: hydroxymethylbilane synthase [Oscillospiraceae bacterium]|nr:hydroxymethylbilane synthase [Oscillospiraceae bacterium]